jgi:glycosyltransferase involved in cell wall biosynthesis
LRILHAYKIYRPDIEGGIPAVMSSLAQATNAAISHAILCARRRGMARNSLIDGVPVEAVSSLGTLFSTPLAPAYIPAFIWRARAADVVIHHAPLPLTDAAILLGLPSRVGLIVYWHADIVGYGLLLRLVAPLIRRALARADRIVVSGQPMIDGSDFLRPHAAKCVVMPYGMDLDYWRALDADEENVVAEMQRTTPRHIVSLGRLVGYKGYDVLLRAMRNIDGHATIIGEGPLLAELQQLATELGVADRVRFAGRLDRGEIRKLFHAAQVFAFPSVTVAEAFGIVQVEAMAAGLPIVNTSLPTTVPLVARHEHEALTVVPGDADALAAALNKILDEPEVARRLGEGGRARARDEFDQSVFRTRMEVVYTDALASRRHQAGT